MIEQISKYLFLPATTKASWSARTTTTAQHSFQLETRNQNLVRLSLCECEKEIKR